MNDYRLNWNPPAEPLGAARDRSPLSLTPAQRAAGLAYKFEHAPSYPDYKHIPEQDCRQIKGAAQPVREVQTPAADASQAVAAPPEGWVPKVGDRVRILRCNNAQSKDQIGMVGKVEFMYSHLRFFDVLTDDDPSRQYAYNVNEVEPLTTSPSNAGWIEHDGGKCPDVVKRWPGKFMIRFSGGAEEECDDFDANDIVFENDGDPTCNVIAYRLIQD